MFVGPVCDYSVAPIARYSAHWQTPVLSAGAMAHDLMAHDVARGLTHMAHDLGTDKRAEYGLLTRIGVTFDSPELAAAECRNEVDSPGLHALTHLGLVLTYVVLL